MSKFKLLVMGLTIFMALLEEAHELGTEEQVVCELPCFERHAAIKMPDFPEQEPNRLPMGVSITPFVVTGTASAMAVYQIPSSAVVSPSTFTVSTAPYYKS